MEWYTAALKKYTVFSGRARRKEYWMFCLFNVGFSILAMILDTVIGKAMGGSGIGVIYLLYVLAVLIPSIAVGVRRLHDTGKSGWFLFIGLIPLIGGIWLLIVLCSEGEAAPNKYGLNPKLATAFT